MNRWIGLFCINLVITINGFSQHRLYIGILRSQKITELKVAVDSGSASVNAFGVEVFRLTKEKPVKLSFKKRYIKAIIDDVISADNFIIKTDSSQYLSLLINSEIYQYKGDLLVEYDSIDKTFILTNIVDINDYLGSVMLGEIGGLDGEEFLKAMAVVSRTYALKNTYKHKNDQFDLCDGVHCQVYKGDLFIPNAIIQAIEETGNEVIIDRDSNLIDAVFYANSGGITSDVEYVWNVEASYLKSKVDSFSQNGRGYAWEYKILKKDWLDYLSKKVRDTVSGYYCETNFDRRKNYYCNEIPISLVDIRYDLRLRSTLFIVEENVDTVNGDYLIFYGRGYGHGVGFSQEGGYEMGKQGYNYVDIIKYYYTSVKVLDYFLLQDY